MKLPRSSFAVLPILLAASFALGGCGGNTSETTTSSGDTTTDDPTTTGTGASGGAGGGGADAGGAGGAGGDPQPQPLIRKTLKGDVTWNVTFDDAAKAAGATDCSYTRTYTGVEDRSAPWLCPSCEIMFFADVELSAGLDDCFKQVTSSTPAAKEWIGYGNGVYWRGAGAPMTEQGTVTVGAADVQTANMVEGVMVPVGGTLVFNIAGDLALGEEEGDPMNGFVPPATYACGWPKANPPEYTGDYVLKQGAVMPDGLFKDACDETVRLHDFKGSYLIVDMSARDCPPCQQMATEEEAFLADMAAQGIDVKMVTLLCPSLSDVVGNTTQAMLKTWTTKYDLTSPVLADRGFGLAMFEPAIGAANVGYPSWAILDKDLVVMDFTTGYGGFEDAKALILADAQ